MNCRKIQTKSSKKTCAFAKMPLVPDKLYFTIGEVSKLCLLKPHVVRYWEQEFPKLNPVKRKGNRRYYKKDEVLLIRRIKKLLYEDGFTIEGARARLSTDSTVDILVSSSCDANTELEVTEVAAIITPVVNNAQPKQQAAIQEVISSLESILHALKTGSFGA